MTKKFSMADLTASLLGAEQSQQGARSFPQNGGTVQHAPSEVVTNCDNLPPRAVRRCRPPSLIVAASPVAQPSARQQQRDARAYAENWHQALKDWQRRSGGLLVIHDPGRSGTGRQMVPVVGNWNSTPSEVLRYPEVHTPMGWVAESALAVRCNAEPYLGRLRNGQGLVSLIHANGRGWNGAEARVYAVVVLKMAADLGDDHAIYNLELLIVREPATISIELDDL